jgi:hypothetical protein
MGSGLRGVIYLISGLASVACVAQEPETGGGSGQAGPATLSSRFDGGVCGPLGNLTGITPSCRGFEEYTTCIERECADGYDTCLGSGWRLGDTTDGYCGDLMECIAGSPDPCDHGCVASTSCQDCLAGQLSICETYCQELVSCDASPTSTDTGCAALTACCNSLDPSLGEMCALEQQDAVAGGDSACDVLVLRYCPNG